LRLRVVSPNLRASLVASARQIHELNVDILQRLHARQPDGGFEAEAFGLTERGRARSLLEVLGEFGAESGAEWIPRFWDVSASFSSSSRTKPIGRFNC
jgi:hypothetical protein